MSVYGPVITGGDVRQAVQTTIETWIDAYLAEVAVQHGRNRGDLPSFNSITSSPRGVNTWPEDQLPACVIVCPGLAKDPREMGNGDYTGEWSVGVGVVCSGMDQETTNELVELYCAAVRGALLQHQSLGGFASDTRWVDEMYNELTFDSSRTLAGGIVNIGVSVDAVLNSHSGLRNPPVDPNVDPGELPQVGTAGVTTQMTQDQ